MISVE